MVEKKQSERYDEVSRKQEESIEMKTVEHILKLQGPKAQGGKASPDAIGHVLSKLEPALRATISMGFRYTSKIHGRPPGWLTRASDIRFVDISSGPEDSTLLHFEAPRFGEAAEDVYRQHELFSVYPKQTDTGFDLFGDVLDDIQKREVDSFRFDSPLLNKIKRSNHSAYGIDSITLSGDRISTAAPPSWDARIADIADEMRQDIPLSQRIRIAGKLDMIRSSDNCFELLLEDEIRVDGLLEGGDMGDFRSLFEQDVVAEGMGVFRVSGKLLRIEATALKPATETDSFFRRLPTPSARGTRLSSFLQPQTARTGVAAVYGKWPGDETEEELLAALKELG